MKACSLVLAALLASPLVAQVTPPLLEVKPDPTNSTAQWVAHLNPEEPVYDLEMRITAKEGGWVVPAIDAYANHLGAPNWLAKANPTPLSSLIYPGILTCFTEPSVELSVFSFDYVLRSGFRDVFSLQPKADYVVNWYVPLLKNGGQRVWHSSPPVWVLNLGPHAWISRMQWEAMNTEFINGNSYQKPTVFSGESVFRYGLLLRAVTSAQPPGAVDQYLESEAFRRQAALPPSAADLGFQIQGVWLMDPSNPTPGTLPQNAPRLSLPPFAAVSNAVTIPLCLPPPGPTPFPYAFLASNLLGTFTPGETRYFSLSCAIPPVRVVFPTTTGPTTVVARSEVTLWNPIQYRVGVPGNVTTGVISATDARDFPPIQVGQVLPTFP